MTDQSREERIRERATRYPWKDHTSEDVLFLFVLLDSTRLELGRKNVHATEELGAEEAMRLASVVKELLGRVSGTGTGGKAPAE